MCQEDQRAGMNGQRKRSLPRPSGLIDATTAEFAHKLMALRKWERENLPMFSPQIAMDVLLHCASSALYDEPAATKEFYLTTGYSKDRLREIAQQLIDQGLVCYLIDPQDTRVKRVMLTPKGALLVDRYRAEMLKHVGMEADIE